MKRIGFWSGIAWVCLALVVGVSLVVVSGCRTGGPGKAGEAWVRLTDYAGGFSVLLPGRAKEVVSTNGDAYGQGVAVHQWTVERGPGLAMSVFYNDFPGSSLKVEAMGPHAFFEQVMGVTRERMGAGRVLYSREGRFSGYPMREEGFEVPGRKLRLDVRLLVVERRMYQLIVASSVAEDGPGEAETFFKSFHLLYAKGGD